MHDPVGFIRDCVKFRKGKGLAPYQAEIIAELPKVKRIAIRGPRGLGKSSTASLVVLWFAVTRDAAGTGTGKSSPLPGHGSNLRIICGKRLSKWSLVPGLGEDRPAPVLFP